MKKHGVMNGAVKCTSVMEVNIAKVSQFCLILDPGCCSKMEFLAIGSLRISLKLSISAAREQQAVGLGHLMRLHHG